jgi:hypothetical protein
MSVRSILNELTLRVQGASLRVYIIFSFYTDVNRELRILFRTKM